MIAPGIDVQFAHLLAAERRAGNHPLHCFDDHTLRMLAVQDLICGPTFDAAGIARVPVIDFVVPLVAAEGDLLRIDDDDVVTAVDVRRVHGLMFAAEAEGNLAREAAENQAFGINHVPFSFHVCGLCRIGFHDISITKSTG